MPGSPNESLAPALKPISADDFEIIVWTFTSVATAFLIARLSIRLYLFRKLAWDDVLVVVAWAQLLSSSIISHVVLPFIRFEYESLVSGEPLTMAYVISDLHFLRYFLTTLLLFYLCIWSIKFSFLLFFRQLNSGTRSHRIWWWVVFAVTTAALAASIADVPYVCLTSNLDGIYSNCDSDASTKSFQRIIYGNMVIDVATDALILTIPVVLLWNVRISTKRKMILFSLFSITVLIMIIAIARAIVIRYPHSNHPSSNGWILTWNFIEMSVAVIIACVASFRQFFVGKAKHEPHDSTSSGRSTSVWNLLKGLRRSTSPSDQETSSSHESGKIDALPDLSLPSRLYVPFDKREAGSIYVQSTIDVASEDLPLQPEALHLYHQRWIPAEQV